MKPAFILINDIHIDKQKGDLVKDIFRQIIDIALEKDIEHVVIGGDVFTNRSGQPLDCLSTFQDIIDMCAQNEIHIDVIPGNHDKTDPDDYRSYVDIYRGNKTLSIYREGYSAMIGGCIVSFVPYFDDAKWKEEFNKAVAGMKRIKKARDIAAKSFLVTHIAINGVRNNDGSEVVCDLKPTMFDCYDRVLVGHYHNASKIGKNVSYTGSAYQNDFGENSNDKGCSIIYDSGLVEFIPLKFPKYIKHVIDVNDSETLRNLLDVYEGETYNHVRFVFRGKKVDASKVDLTYIGSKGIQCSFESVEEKEAIETSTNADALNFDKKTIKKDFIRFCAENGIKGLHMKYGLNLIKNI